MSIKHRFDFTSIMAKVSTWLALLSASFGAASIAYSSLPVDWQQEFPDGFGGLLAMAAVGCAFLVPIATSFKQRNLGRATQVVITTETKVEGDVSPEAATAIAADSAGSPKGGTA